MHTYVFVFVCVYIQYSILYVFVKHFGAKRVFAFYSAIKIKNTKLESWKSHKLHMYPSPSLLCIESVQGLGANGVWTHGLCQTHVSCQLTGERVLSLQQVVISPVAFGRRCTFVVCARRREVLSVYFQISVRGGGQMAGPLVYVCADMQALVCVAAPVCVRGAERSCSKVHLFWGLHVKQNNFALINPLTQYVVIVFLNNPYECLLTLTLLVNALKN